MFGGSHWIWIVGLLIIALIIFGPNRLPEVGSGLGKAIREFRKATTETTDHLKSSVEEPPQTHTPPPPQPQQPPAENTPVGPFIGGDTKP